MLVRVTVHFRTIRGEKMKKLLTLAAVMLCMMGRDLLVALKGLVELALGDQSATEDEYMDKEAVLIDDAQAALQKAGVPT